MHFKEMPSTMYITLEVLSSKSSSMEYVIVLIDMFYFYIQLDVTFVGKEALYVYDKLIIIAMAILMSYFFKEHIAFSHKKWCEHGIRKNQQIKSTSHHGESYLKFFNYVSINQDKA